MAEQKRKRGPAPYPVRVRGRVFPSAKDAAAFYGLKEGTVRTSVNAGRADFIGTGSGTWQRGDQALQEIMVRADAGGANA